MDAASALPANLIWYIGLAALLLFILLYKWTFRLLGVYIIPDTAIGTVVKKFVLFGANKQLPPGKIVALKGEAGIQCDTLPPGLHIGLWPWQYDIAIVAQKVIPSGQIGVVESCDGRVLPDGRIIARQVDCDNFQDARAFLEAGGERGPQMALLSPGTWRINPLVFRVTPVPMTFVEAGEIGVVEARDGKPLTGGRIIGRTVSCDSFQDARAFVDGGGERGPQMDIIPQGTYRINPVLFRVEKSPVTDVPDGKIGIITTREGTPLKTGDIAGPEVPGHNMFQDPMQFVANGGTKGLQEQVLLNGRYFINPKFATVEFVEQTNVPTANVVLNWATGRTESHNLDAKLSTITVRSADGFSYNLDVSQIIHIPRNDAPRVIARFGSMEALVTQVLEPTIGNYFRNTAQGSDVIDFLTKRTERQKEAKEAISHALAEYNVGAVETLIGDINPPAELMKPLTERKVAETQKHTFEVQTEAQAQRQQLEQAKALADTQPEVVAAERKVAIAKFNAESAVAAARGEAEAKTINAGADAGVTRINGDAIAAKTLAIGEAEAKVIKQKIESMDAANYALVQVANALAAAGEKGMKIVPDVLVNGGGATGANGGGSIVDVLIANLIRDNLKSK
jgi:uncharacterized membrane protein YqiK